jgi:hypothetical protein
MPSSTTRWRTASIFIDTAKMYSVPARAETSGASERIVGRWLAASRATVSSSPTKVAGPSRNLDWIRGGPPALDRANIRAGDRRLAAPAAHRLHRPLPTALAGTQPPMFGQWQYDPTRERDVHADPRTARRPRRTGPRGQGPLCRSFHNEHPWGIMQFVRLAEEHGLPRHRRHAECLQPAQPHVRKHAGRSLPSRRRRPARLFAARLRPPERQVPGRPGGVDGRIARWPAFGQRYTKPNVGPAVAAYAELARAHGLTPTQLALGFVRSRGFVTSTIIGASSLAQLQKTLPATQTAIPADLLEAIDAIHLRYTNPAP